MVLHGLAYAFFFRHRVCLRGEGGPAEIHGFGQALYTVATFGLGMFLGTQFAGVVMDRLKDGDRFRWRLVFLVPCATLVVCALSFVLFFGG